MDAPKRQLTDDLDQAIAAHQEALELAELVHSPLDKAQALGSPVPGWSDRTRGHRRGQSCQPGSVILIPVTWMEVGPGPIMNRAEKLKVNVDESMVEEIISGMRQGSEAKPLNNDSYRLRLPEPGSEPFVNLGNPGYEAQRVNCCGSPNRSVYSPEGTLREARPDRTEADEG